MQKRICNFTWLDHIQCEKNVYNFQPGSIKSKKRVCKSTLDPNGKKKHVCNFTLTLPLGPMIVTGHCEIN